MTDRQPADATVHIDSTPLAPRRVTNAAGPARAAQTSPLRWVGEGRRIVLMQAVAGWSEMNVGKAQSVGPVTTVESWLTVEVSEPASVAFQLAATPGPGSAAQDALTATLDGRPVLATVVVDQRHGRQHLVNAGRGTLEVTYRGAVARHAQVPEALTDTERLSATRPSRYCPSDRMAGFARGHFADISTSAERVRAICEYVWRHTNYETGVTTASSDAVDTLLSGHGVCRDFAHLVVALCRAVDVPARVAAVYAPGLSPMDFHVVAEAAVDGAWWVFDATRSAPRQTLVRIATGRDAADIAFMTVLSGRAALSTVEVGAVAGADLPTDDHHQLLALS